MTQNAYFLYNKPIKNGTTSDHRGAQGSEVHLGYRQTVVQVRRTSGISEQTFYRLRREYGELNLGQAMRLKAPGHFPVVLSEISLSWARLTIKLPELKRGLDFVARTL